MDEFEVKATCEDMLDRIWTRNDLDTSKLVADQAVSRLGYTRAVVVNTFGGDRSDPLYVVGRDSAGNLLKLLTRAADMKMLRANHFPRLHAKYLSAILVVEPGVCKPKRIDAFEVASPTLQDKPATFWSIKDRFVDTPECEACSATENLHIVNNVWLCLKHADWGFSSETSYERLLK